ncbi:MAG: cation-transporting P-type ATPase [Desulfurella sp.]
MRQLSKEEFKNLTYERIFELLETNESGLSAEEVAKRQKEFGFNEIPEKKKNLNNFFF